jgi:RNA-binding protein YhbY
MMKVRTNSLTGPVPTITIGKAGLTDDVIKELKRQIAKHKTIRIQLNRDIAGGKSKVEQKRALAAMLGARVQKAVGFVLVLTKE